MVNLPNIQCCVAMYAYMDMPLYSCLVALRSMAHYGYMNISFNYMVCFPKVQCCIKDYVI